MIKDIVREVNKDGATIFLTTHNMEEANQLCDRIAIIRMGRIVAVDSPEKLKAQSKGLQSIEISFDRPVDLDSVPLSGITKAVKVGDKFRLYTGDPDSVVKQLVDYAEEKRLKIISLNLLSPSLEDVFVELTRKEA
ncbi:DUF4162 domain-containing protein [Methanocella paludicola]|uniref:ATP-binding protein DrrA1-3 family domain-containing protein n=1 Tax=Methanocella paludicola TaxID=570267 RepID=UPI000AC41C90|nr:DUF4162 domain-containing protein [Methanocella paludicola]